jgi:signal transduction histidine kinase
LLDNLKIQLQDAVVEIRRLVNDLRPSALDELGLSEALREGIVGYQQGGLDITLDMPDALPALPAAVEVAAYRIAHEAITNVVRHAHARSCAVRLSLAASGGREALCLEVMDDGDGLPEDVRAGVGLQSMRERAAELGGEFKVEGRDGAGTRVVAKLPLPQEM